MLSETELFLNEHVEVICAIAGRPCFLYLRKAQLIVRKCHSRPVLEENHSSHLQSSKVPECDIKRLRHEYPRHVPVMQSEVLDILGPESGKTYLDMTFGAGGHTKALLQSATDVKVFGLDQDPVAYEIASELEKTE